MPTLLRPRDADLSTTPWRRRDRQGLYWGRGRDVWTYWELPLAPLAWEDAGRRLEVGRILETLLEEIGQLSRDIGQGMKMLSQNRSIHIFGATYAAAAVIPEEAPDQLVPFLSEVLDPTVGRRVLLLGVKLRPATLPTMGGRKAGRGTRGVLGTMRDAVNAFGDGEDSFDAFKDDYEAISVILKRNGARQPARGSLAQLESWFNDGHGADVPIAAENTSFHVNSGTEYEISALMGFDEAQLTMDAPYAQWLLDSMTHPDPAVAVSIRGDLEPASVTRNRLRRTRRKLRAAEEEEEKTGDIGRDENQSLMDASRDLENYVRTTGTPWLVNTSVLLAREVSAEDETYLDMLRTTYGANAKPLEKRQLKALAEMQPCGPRTNPFLQDFNPAMVAYAGLASYSNLGEDAYLWMGTVDPDATPLFLHPFGASLKNLPPVMGVFGDPGSGKTFACQILGGQGAIGGVSVFMINPKGHDTLAPWARWVESMGAPAQVISMRKMEEQGGAFDPFRFCNDPQMAAEILTRHILTVLGKSYDGGLTAVQEILLGEALAKGAKAGARCAYEALAYVEDPDTVQLIAAQERASTLFALALGKVPREPWGTNGGLTLIEFDRELPLPKAGKDPSSYEREERLALAAMRLVTRASMEVLMQSNGGMLIVDEAHHFLSSPEGLASLDRLAREGRSLGLLPIFATQRPSDLLAVDMEMFMSRVLVMKLTDPAEASAALRLCKMEDTAARVDFLRKAGPRRGSDGVPGRGARGFFKDLDDRHAMIEIGPVPERIRLALSTNRADRQVRDAEPDGSGGQGQPDPTPGSGS